MKKLMSIMMIAAITLCFSIVVKAADNSGAGSSLKIAVVDLGRALNEVSEGKKAKSNLEKEFKSKKKELDGMKDDLTALRSKLEQKSHLLSQEAMKEKSEDFQRKFVEYQQKAKEYTEQLSQKEGEITGKILEKLSKVVQDIAKRDGYTFVLEKSHGGVVYGPDNSDITSEVISRYNK